MRLTDLYLATFIVIFLLTVFSVSMSMIDLYIPGASSNYSVPTYNYSFINVTEFKNQTQTIAQQDFSSSGFFEQLTQAFGMSVWFGIKMIQMVITMVFAVPAMAVGIPLAFLGMIGIDVVAFPMAGEIVIFLELLIGVIISIMIIRLFKPDL